MTPAKQKAEELILKFREVPIEDSVMWYVGYEISKECALIAVNVALEALDEHQWQNQHIIAEYNQIKKEIENYG